MTSRPAVAVIGSGVAGLTAAYLLQRRYQVTLFEADDRLGGHAHTHELITSDGHTTYVDSGFIVHNTRTYPNLMTLFGELGVATQDTEMSMSVRCEGCGLEYAGARRLGGLFPQPSNLARPHYLRMLGEVLRFHRHARRVLADERAGDIPLGAFLAVGGYTRYFTEHFMLPVVSAVWSAGETVSLSYPARYLFTFLDHHGMLAVGGSPSWRTVVGGSRSYVQRAVKGLTAVQRRHPGPGGDPHRRRRRDPGRRGPRAPVRPSRRGHPPGPGAGPADRSHRRRARGARARSATRATRPGCTRTPRCCPAAPGPGRRGTTSSRPARRPTARCWSATT